MSIKLNFERDGEISDYEFTNDTNGMRALGELVFIALEGHAAFIMITPNDLEDLAEEENAAST